MNIMKIWYLKWGNGMVGIFNDSNLDQISNVSEKELDSEFNVQYASRNKIINILFNVVVPDWTLIT